MNAIEIAIGVAAVVAIAGVLVWAYLRARRWRDMVVAVAERYRIKCLAPTGVMAMGTATAFGPIREIDIDLKIDEETRGTGDRSTTTRFLNLSASGDFDERLRLHDRKRKSPQEDAGLMDFGDTGEAAETPIGDPAFDARLRVRGASPGLVTALASGDLRKRVMDLAEWGLVVEGGNITLRTRRFPSTKEQMFELVDGVVTLAQDLAARQR